MAHLYVTKQIEIWKTANKLYESNEVHGLLICRHFFTETIEMGHTDTQSHICTFNLQTY